MGTNQLNIKYINTLNPKLIYLKKKVYIIFFKAITANTNKYHVKLIIFLYFEIFFPILIQVCLI